MYRIGGVHIDRLIKTLTGYENPSNMKTKIQLYGVFIGNQCNCDGRRNFLLYLEISLCDHVSEVVALSDSTSAGWLIPSLSLSYLFTSRY